MKHLEKTVCLFLVVIYLLLGACACKRQRSIPKNIILCITDGAGYNHFKATSLYQYGKVGMQVYDRFPVKLAMSIHSADGHAYKPEEAWETFDFVRFGPPDSAASATSMAAGVKTYNGAIGVDMNKKELETFFEKAEKKGKATGLVTSVQFAHATPAGFVAHNVGRENYVQIVQEMILKSPVDVIMGCGHPYYNRSGKPRLKPRFDYVGGEAAWQALTEGFAGSDADGDGTADPWALIQAKHEFQALISGTTPKRVLGIPQVYQTLQQERSGDGSAEPFVVPFIDSIPNLVEMTLAALNVLGNDPDGFYLMVEGGAVDWAGHDQQFGRMIEEQVDFNKTIEAVVRWVEEYSTWDETMVIVTSDHETGYLNGPGSGEVRPAEADSINDVWLPLVNNGQGKLPGMQWGASGDDVNGHTNSLVPFYAKGAGSRQFKHYADETDLVRGNYLDNTEIAKLIFSFLE